MILRPSVGVKRGVVVRECLLMLARKFQFLSVTASVVTYMEKVMIPRHLGRKAYKFGTASRKTRPLSKRW